MSGLLQRRTSARPRDATTTLALLDALTAATGIELPVRLWDGTEVGVSAGFRVLLRHPWSARALIGRLIDVSAGEAYVWGDIDVDGDMVAALDRVAQLAERGISPRGWPRLLRLARTLPPHPARPHDRRAHLNGRRHSPERDRQAIAFHYDLPVDFYRTFLDEDLVYSCAYFAEFDLDNPSAKLGEAQARKLELVCRKLRLRPGMRLLDVGCGWGSLVLHGARRHGVHAVGVTLSEAQAAIAVERVAAAGLAERVEIRQADYRELPPQDRFDAIASVGMVEHVGPTQLAEYFASLHELLVEGGLLLNHGIVTGSHDDVREEDDSSFVGRYVFPDGGLVPAWRMVRELEASGLHLLDVEQLRPHYAATLRAWVARLEERHAPAVVAASEADYRIWRAYMAGSALNFQRGHLGVVQLLGGRGLPTLPPGRAWMDPAA